MATANEDLRDAAVRHRIYLLRHEEFLYRKLLLDFLNAMDADLTAGIGTRMSVGKINWGGSFTTRRMLELHGFTRELINAMSDRILADLSSGLGDLAEHEAEWQAGTITAAVPVKLDLVTPPPEMLRAIVTEAPLAGMYLKDWTARWGAAKQERVTQAIRIGLGEGQTAEQIVARIAGTKARNYQDGILEISRQGARGLVRTASNSVSTAARDMLFEENRSVLKGVVWCSTLDSRTCLVAGTLLETPSGPRSIDTVAVGDQVIGGSGSPRRVTATRRAPAKALARVTLSNGAVVICTPDHLWLTARGQWVEAQRLAPGDILAERMAVIDG